MLSFLSTAPPAQHQRVSQKVRNDTQQAEFIHSCRIHVRPRVGQVRISHILEGVSDRESGFYFVAHELPGQGASRNLEINNP